MKKILAGCLAAAMFCGGMAMAEAPGGNSLRAQIDAASGAQVTLAPEMGDGFTTSEGSGMESNFMIPQAVEMEETAETEAEQTRRQGSLMSQINAAKNGEVSVGIIGGADGPTEIYVSVPEETEVEVVAPPEWVVAEPSAVPEAEQTRRQGSLMSQINAAKQGEAVSVDIIGGQDGPTAVFVAVPEPVAIPEIAENTATEPIPAEEEAPPAFVLRDSITWDSTKEEIKALFEGYDTDGYPIEDMLLEIEAVEIYDVKVSLFEGDMFFYFYEDRLWAMGYYLDFDDGDADKLRGSLTVKYGAPEFGADVFMGIVNPISTADMQVEEDEYETYTNWTAPQNTAVILATDAYSGMLGYFNMDYVKELHAAAAVNEFFGI